MLSSTQTLLRRPRRILVAGVSGVGKSTLSRRIADATGSPYTEIDGLFHGPDWTPRASFETDVDTFTQAAAWVTEWQYTLESDYPHLQVVLMRSQREVEEWLSGPLASR